MYCTLQQREWSQDRDARTAGKNQPAVQDFKIAMAGELKQHFRRFSMPLTGYSYCTCSDTLQPFSRATVQKDSDTDAYERV